MGAYSSNVHVFSVDTVASSAVSCAVAVVAEIIVQNAIAKSLIVFIIRYCFKKLLLMLLIE